MKHGVSSYSEITPESIRNMTEYFSIKEFFSNEHQGIAIIMITPKQYLVVYSKDGESLLNHDKFIEICENYICAEDRNPTIIIELTHKPEIDQCIIELPKRKFNPISDKMNRLKLYIEKIVRYYQPVGIQSECSDDFIFVRKKPKLNCTDEIIVGITIDKANAKMRKLCEEIHNKRKPTGRRNDVNLYYR